MLKLQNTGTPDGKATFHLFVLVTSTSLEFSCSTCALVSQTTTNLLACHLQTRFHWCLSQFTFQNWKCRQHWL